MEKNMTTKDEMEQVKALKEKAKAEPDPTVYTHVLKKPFTFEGKTVEQLDFNFGTLTGADTAEIESELNHRLKNLVLPQLSWEFMTLAALRACTNRTADNKRVVDEKFLKALPMRDYNRIIGAVRTFLLASDSPTAAAETGSGSNA